jgi:multiple sugar transport system substrate-binding protein
LRISAVILAAALAIAPLAVRAADLVVWWQSDLHQQEDEAVAEIIAAFEQETGKQVELVQPAQGETIEKAQAALEAGRSPDFLFGVAAGLPAAQWAYEDRLVNLEGALNPVLDLFDADAIEVSTLLDGSTGRRGLFALPMGRHSNHLHVWNSLLAQAGFTLDDLPKEWDAFWSFWCDQVQPAVRRATGRDDIWGVGLPMSVAAPDTDYEFFQFQLAYEAPWIGLNRRPQVDDPTVRAGLVKALDAYTAIWRKGCTPPESANWTNIDNNKAFLAQTVVMTPNPTLSIPAALRTARPDDYYQHAATIDWPDGANGQQLVIEGLIARAVVFKAGGKGARRRLRALPRRGGMARALAHLRGRPVAAADAQACRAAVLAGFARPASHACGRADPDPAAPRSNSGSTGQGAAVAADIRGERLGQRRPPRRERRHPSRAGGRRGDRPHQADPERITRAPAALSTKA